MSLDDRPREEFILAYTLTPLRKGEVFKVWPLHITVVPWFILPENDVEEAVIDISEITSKYDAIPLKGEGRVQFGPHSVIVTDKPKALQALHDELVALLQNHEWDIAAKQYTGKRFKPHITDRKHRLEADVKLTLDSIVLVKAPIANPLDRLKTVIDVFMLGGQNA